MDVRPISGLVGAAAYRPFHPGAGRPLMRHPPPVADVVEISPEARALADRYAQPFPRDGYWDQVRYDPPHTDDPDFPWEIAHNEWLEMIARVFGPRDPAADPSLPGNAPSAKE